jgi:hypothetical protein
MSKKTPRPDSKSRREFVKKAAYIAPAILTLQAASSVAKAGSVKPTPAEDGYNIRLPRTAG